MIENNKFKVIKNAKVSVQYIEQKNDVLIMLSVEDEKPFVFPLGRNENKMVFQMDVKSVEEFFQGGSFVFLDGDLIDYRTSEFLGYLRSAEEMSIMGDVIGIERKTNAKSPAMGLFNSFRNKTLDGSVFLGGKGKSFNLEIDGFGEGGHFVNNLVHRWSPFGKNVVISLETERLICTNGMVGMSPFVTNEVPIVNRVREHLELVEVQLEPHINGLLHDRFKNMAKNPASVGSLMAVNSTLDKRVKGLSPSTPNDVYERLLKLTDLVDVRKNLKHVYDPSVFSNKELSGQLSGNLTQFDLFNVLTEASTHSIGNHESNKKLQVEVNKLVFDELSEKKNIQGKVPNSEMSNHNLAFFGK